MNFKDLGKANLNGVKGFDTETIKAKQDKFKLMIETVENVGIDLDSCVELIIKDFRIESENTTKKFYKVAKKGDKKIRLKFIKEEVLKFWIKEVEEKDLTENIKDLRELLSEEIFLSYLAGIYISIHSKNLASEILNLLKSILAEMFLSSAQKVNPNN